MKPNKAIDYALIALRYWSENTEMGQQVYDQATAALKTLKEDEPIKVTFELSREQLKEALIDTNSRNPAVLETLRTLKNEEDICPVIKKEWIDARDATRLCRITAEALQLWNG